MKETLFLLVASEGGCDGDGSFLESFEGLDWHTEIRFQISEIVCLHDTSHTVHLYHYIYL